MNGSTPPLAHLLTHSLYTSNRSYFVYVQLRKLDLSIRRPNTEVDIENRTECIRQFSDTHTHIHSTHSRNVGNECVLLETEKNGFTGIGNNRMEYIGETRIYMRDTMRILKDQFYGNRKM